MHFAMRTYFIGGIFLRTSLAQPEFLIRRTRDRFLPKLPWKPEFHVLHFVMKLGTSQCDFLHVRLNTDSCLRKLVPFFIVNTVIFSALKFGSEQVILYIVVPSKASFE